MIIFVFQHDKIYIPACQLGNTNQDAGGLRQDGGNAQTVSKQMLGKILTNCIGRECFVNNCLRVYLVLIFLYQRRNVCEQDFHKNDILHRAVLCIVNIQELDGVALLVMDPPSVNSTPFVNSLLGKPS